METPIVAPPAIDNSHIALYIGAGTGQNIVGAAVRNTLSIKQVK